MYIFSFLQVSKTLGGFELIQGSLIVYSSIKCSYGFRVHDTDDVVGSDHDDRPSSKQLVTSFLFVSQNLNERSLLFELELAEALALI